MTHQCVYNDPCDWDSEAAGNFMQNEAGLLISDVHGVYVMHMFAKYYGKMYGVPLKDRRILTGIKRITDWLYDRHGNDPDIVSLFWERYDEISDWVVDNCTYTSATTGKTYRLQWIDGSLFDVPEVDNFCPWCDHADDCEDKP